MANFTQRMYLENYHPDEKTTVVDLNQHALTIINGPHDEVETALKKGKKVVAVPGKHYVAGPIVDRLAEFESLGFEPGDLKSVSKEISELLAKRIKKKVDVTTEFDRCLVETGQVDSSNVKLTYAEVKETRTYRCPCCGTKLDERYKTTKLYPNRTIGTEGIIRNCVQYQCGKCGQALDWDEVNKEEWS